ncbi:hypothetical protein [uncultured Tateyamaria sp.]|uniref:hypothetical protein n=1 Tax=uncultured Tateyamaria sp. TaxID=455651 RepID=UPI002624692D|nr:hypothetical protein [uncultured Tateyamaria sp.]
MWRQIGLTARIMSEDHALVLAWKGLSTLHDVRQIPSPEIAQTRNIGMLHRRLNAAWIRLLTGLEAA